MALPAPSTAWTVGEPGDDGSIFLHDQPVEGIYGNTWWGKTVNSGAARHIDVQILGEGKTVDFEGTLSLNCANAAGTEWKTDVNFSASPAEIYDLVPGQVLRNAHMIFCR